MVVNKRLCAAVARSPAACLAADQNELRLPQWTLGAVHESIVVTPNVVRLYTSQCCDSKSLKSATEEPVSPPPTRRPLLHSLCLYMV